MAALLVLSGCSSGFTLRATVVVPPTIELSVFPDVLVTAEQDHDSQALAASIVAHLRQRGTTHIAARDDNAIYERRGSGVVSPATGLLRVAVEVSETLRPTLVWRPDTVCSAWGCSTVRRSVLEDIVVVRATARLVLTEAQSDRRLDELVLTESSEGSDAFGSRLNALRRLDATVLGSLTDSLQAFEISFSDAEPAAARSALARIRAGHVAEGRIALEQIAEGPAFGALSAAQQARVLFDIGQAHWAERRGDPDETALRTAESLVRRAISLDPRSEYGRALEQIARVRRIVARRQARDAAAEHNRRLLQAADAQRGATADIPAPPASYGR